MNKSYIYKLLGYIAIIGNVLFILWISFNGMDEGFKASLIQKISYLGILVLLILNSILIGRKNN